MADYRNTQPIICPFFTSNALKLILIRHAKSSWDDFTLDDHDRTLNKRGKASAVEIGKWLLKKGHVPVHIACSTAVRAIETCDRVAQAFGEVPTVYEEGLYHASADRIMRQIMKSPAGDVMIVGHNPGFAEAASLIAQSPVDHPDFRRYPTCATTVFEVDLTNWRDIKPGVSRIVDFVTPRELT